MDLIRFQIGIRSLPVKPSSLCPAIVKSSTKEKKEKVSMISLVAGGGLKNAMETSRTDVLAWCAAFN